MDKIKEYKWVVVTLVIILGFSFYWYQLRPSQIVKVCEKQAEDSSLADLRNLSNLNIQNGVTADTQTADKQYNDYYNMRYQKCLRENGLEK